MKNILIKTQVYLQLFKYIVYSFIHSRELKRITDNTSNVKSGDIIAFITLRNEAFRIKYFLEYYRKLGVNHFIFVDNGSSDGFVEIVSGDEDCSVWYTNASYKKAHFGIHWINHLLRKYGSGHWCLTLDPDEFLVMPHHELRDLNDLIEFLDAQKKENFFTLLLDMYSEKQVSKSVCKQGQDPLEVAPYFDRDGYTQKTNKKRWDMFIQGGVRRRIMFCTEPLRAPALNKTPLIKWKWHYSYISSTHCALPKRLNRPHTPGRISPTGCLLHFKFLSVLQEKANEEINRKEHYDNSIEYSKYAEFMNSDTDHLYDEDISIKFINSNQLCELGLMNKGDWF